MTKAETKTFLELLAEVPEHRKGNAIKYSLRDVLFLAIFAILCGAETYTGMETFSRMHEKELRKYLELPHGIPSHDVFGDILSRVNIGAVNECFRIFTDNLREENIKDSVIALDGKTIRRSQNGEHRAFHIETAYLSDMQIVLGQMQVDEKKNELSVIPKLLKMLTIKGSTVTVDAMGTHDNIAKDIREGGADYIMPVKENQSKMAEDLRIYAENDLFSENLAELEAQERHAVSVSKGHGRVETRECFLFGNIDWINERHTWTDLNGAAVIRSTRTISKTGETSTVDRYFIYSHTQMTAKRFLELQRKHWSIENNLHWCLDCCFHEDDMHVRIGHAAIVINTFRKLCMQMLRADKTVKDSLAGKRQRCAWSFDYAMTVASNYAISDSQLS